MCALSISIKLNNGKKNHRVNNIASPPPSILKEKHITFICYDKPS